MAVADLQAHICVKWQSTVSLQIGYLSGSPRSLIRLFSKHSHHLGENSWTAANWSTESEPIAVQTALTQIPQRGGALFQGENPRSLCRDSASARSVRKDAESSHPNQRLITSLIVRSWTAILSSHRVTTRHQTYTFDEIWRRTSFGFRAEVSFESFAHDSCINGLMEW